MGAPEGVLEDALAGAMDGVASGRRRAALGEVRQAADGARRLFNAWSQEAPTSTTALQYGADADVRSDVTEYERRAADCYRAILRGDADEVGHTIEAVVSVPQHPLLARSVERRATQLARTIIEAREVVDFVEGMAAIVARHFARPEAVAFYVDVTPIEPPDISKPMTTLLDAMEKDAKESRVGAKSTNHVAAFNGLTPRDTLAIVRAVTQKEEAMRAIDWMRTIYSVKNISGNSIRPPWHRVAQWFEALGHLIEFEPWSVSEDYIRKQYNGWRRKSDVSRTRRRPANQ